ncbi:Synaptojanin-1 [Chamberlinius hualienensis]
MLTDLRIHLLTWNVKGIDPSENLEAALELHNELNIDDVPDIYAIGLQEVNTSPRSMLKGMVFEDPWCKAFRETVEKWDYVQLKVERLRGILLLVFVKRRHLLHIRGLQTEYTRTGIGGLWGNKGGVSVRMKMYGCSICIVNCHLAAHDNELNQRIEDYNSIVDGQVFSDIETENILCHDYILWMGDLNFRINSFSTQEIKELIDKSQLDKLLENDQLNIVRRNGQAFAEFNETIPTFKPTYKFHVGMNGYDLGRKPGYTDRILFKVNPDVYENVKLEMEQLSYKSHESYVQSDHKPVSGLFNIKVFVDPNDQFVTFNPIIKWVEGDDRTCYYAIPRSLETSDWDWIGLYKANFSNLEDYISYIWIPQKNEDVPSDTQIQSVHKDFSITFPPTAVLPGIYCLVYVSNDCNSILGISDPFEVNVPTEKPDKQSNCTK